MFQEGNRESPELSKKLKEYVEKHTSKYMEIKVFTKFWGFVAVKAKFWYFEDISKNPT